MNTPGYEQLAGVLKAAFYQAAEGKGAERHADSKPFHKQPMQTSSDLLGTDAGLAFQAIKKIREGSTFTEFDRFERELLGAIVYIAGMIIWRRRNLPIALGEPCLECGYPTDAVGTHYATCPTLSAPAEHIEQAEAAFEEAVGVFQLEPCPEYDWADGVMVECVVPLPDGALNVGQLFEVKGGYITDCYGDLRRPHRLYMHGIIKRHAPVGEISIHFGEQPATPTVHNEMDEVRVDIVASSHGDGEHYDDPFAGAPDWAKWKAQDADGEWCWFENKPVKSSSKRMWLPRVGTTERINPKGDPNPRWRNTLIWRKTLIERPNNKSQE